ncbi:AhpC-TSA-domain-containing protein [Hypoxylon sp. FL0543]|nr:AhpC-TSA-domain-containing protein [Hypoxylon sp. FL0543]
MSLQAQLEAVNASFTNAPAELRDPINTARTEFMKAFDVSGAIQPGQKLPEFQLPDSQNKTVSSSDLLSKGPLLITFYRGAWCPYCNLALHALQSKLADIKAKGVTLVAITPELPDASLSLAEKQKLEFPVLSDVGNKYARQLGIIFKQPDSLRPVFEKLGFDLLKNNGDDSFEVPVPASLLVDRDGTVKKTFVDPDYTKRLEPSVALEWIDSL